MSLIARLAVAGMAVAFLISNHSALASDPNLGLIKSRQLDGQISNAMPMEETAAYGKRLKVTLPGAPPGIPATLAIYHSTETDPVRLPLLTWSTDGKGGGIAEIIVPEVEICLCAWPAVSEETLIFVYRQKPDDPTALQTVFKADIEITSPVQGRWFGLIVVGLLYITVAIGLYFRRKAHNSGQTDDSGRNIEVGFFRSLSPIQVIRTDDGMASLSNFQTLFFTLVIGGLLAFALWTTHSLSDLSDDVMILLGIAGGGSILAKGVDANVTRITGQNWAFLMRLGWLTTSSQPVKAARISDLVMRNDRVDIFRFQNLLFTFIVGVSLFMQEVGGLVDYDIPPAIFGLLGLSQVAYIGGKAVGNDLISELDKALTDLKAKIQALFAKADPAKLTGDPVAQLTYLRETFPADWQAFKVAEQTTQELTKAAFPASTPHNLSAGQLDLTAKPAATEG